MVETKEVVTNEQPIVVEKAKMSPIEKAARIIALVIFPLIIATAIGALVSDMVIVANNILMFVVACLGAVVAFIIGFILMVLSCVLIFGVYLLKENGFWPVSWMQQVFNEVIRDAKITPEQIGILLTVRIIIVVICVLVFAASIVALVLAKKAQKQDKDRKQKLTKAFSIVTLILSVLGIFASLVMILLLAIIA